MNIKNSVSECIRYKSWTGMATCKEWAKKGFLETFWNGAHLEGEEREDLESLEFSRFHQQWERERGIGELEWVDREGRRKKINLL